MILTLVDIVSCENPQCRQFARIAHHTPDLRSYYCQICGTISRPRAVDASLVASAERYEAYLRKAVCSDKEPPRE